MPLSAEHILKRFEAAKARKQNWDQTYRDAYRYALPQRDLYDQPKPGQVKGDVVFDSTAVNSTTHFANRIQSELFPPGQDFFSLEPGPVFPEDDEKVQDEVRELLQGAAKITHAEIHKSNFDSSINETLLELAAGTGILLEQKGTELNPLLFTAIPQIQVALEEGPHGTVGGIYREHDKEIRLIEKEWDDAQVPQQLKDRAADKTDATVKIIEVTYLDDDTGLWTYELILLEEKEKLLKAPRVHKNTSPWITPRWIKAANEVNGRGPLLFAMADIRTVNKAKQFAFQNASLAIAGVWGGVDDGVLNPNTAVIRPGAIIPVARGPGHPQGQSLFPLEMPGRFDLSQIVIENLKMDIKRALLDEQLPPDTGPVRSPTEIVARLRTLAVDTGAAFGRLKRELVVPVVLRSIEILAEFNKLSLPFQVDGSTITVNVTSPLAQQQNLNEIENLVRAMEISAALGPEMVALGFKIEDIPAYIGKKLGVDQTLIRDKKNRGEIQELVAGIIAQQQQAGAQPA